MCQVSFKMSSLLCSCCFKALESLNSLSPNQVSHLVLKGFSLHHFIHCFLGNNIYGSEICQVLQRVKGTAERTAYILMDKIHPAPVKNYLLRRDAPLQIRNCLSELGVFGTYVRCVITISCRLFYFPCAVGRQGLFVLFLQSFQLLIMSELPCTQIEQHHLI